LGSGSIAFGAAFAGKLTARFFSSRPVGLLTAAGCSIEEFELELELDSLPLELSFD
jgi:hypothetical protein